MRNTWKSGIVAAALVTLVGCSHSSQGRTSTTQVGASAPAGGSASRSDPIAREMDRVVAEADGNQPGRVKEVAEGYLVLDPYQQAAGDSTLVLDPKVPVFQGQGRVTADALQPGTDVRVFYRLPPAGDGKPEIVGVEILDPTQAREINDAIRDAPKSNDGFDREDEELME